MRPKMHVSWGKIGSCLMPRVREITALSPKQMFSRPPTLSWFQAQGYENPYHEESVWPYVRTGIVTAKAKKSVSAECG